MPTDLDDATRVDDSRLRDFAKEALIAAGVEKEVAGYTAEGLRVASVRGVDSHGIRLLPHYLKEVEGGRINPEPKFTVNRTTASTARLDADDAFGLAAGKVAMDHAIRIAKESGVGNVSVYNSSHCGSLAYFGLEAASEEMLGFATTHGTANSLPPNGVRPMFGNNPLCLAAPMAAEGPFCYDAAMTPITFNKVKQHRETGEPLPPGAAANDEGQETQDPQAAAHLLYLGDYKGYGLAMVSDILCGLLSGMPVGRNISSMYGDPVSEPRKLGHFFSAMRIDAFEDTKTFKSRLQNLAEEVRNGPTANGEEIQVPGDPEKRTRAQREREGVPVPPHDLERFAQIAERFGIEPIDRSS